jgi:hypothetical protein
MVAEVETADGTSIQHSYSHETVGTPSGDITRATRHEEIAFYRPADHRHQQPARIPVLHRHDRSRQVGTVAYLKWIKPDNRIVAVCEVDVDEAAHWLAAGDCYVSPGVRSRPLHARNVDIELDHLGLVASTARVAARPVQWAVTSFEERRRWTRQTVPSFDLLVAAAEARRRRRAGEPLEIVGHPDIPQEDETPPLFRDAVRPIRTTASPFDERVGAAVRAGADPWGAMWKAGGQSGAMLWDDPISGATYGIR